jgi:DNA replication protein DnaC
MIPFDPATLDIDAMLKRLHLANTRRCWPQLTEQAGAEQWSHRDFLATVLAEAIGHRHGTRLRRAAHDAHFPFLKTVDDFDFTQQTAIRPALLGNYLGADFVTEGRNLILMGKTGRGKTHLAVAIAYRAIQNGFTALFTTAAALIDDLSAASRDGRLRDSLLLYLQPHVLVVDEVGYLTYGLDAANVLFHVVNDRHLKKRPLIFTTNKSPLTAWGAVLHDQDLAEAIVDRTLERGRLLVLDGPSYRTRHLPLDSSESNSDHADKPARVSGKHRPQFPEPTAGIELAGNHRLVREGGGRNRLAEPIPRTQLRWREPFREERPARLTAAINPGDTRDDAVSPVRPQTACGRIARIDQEETRPVERVSS